MATASVELDAEILNCSICLEQFKTPKYLPCSHTFCELCLQSYAKSEVQNEKAEDSFKCPICRVLVKRPDTGLSIDKFVEQLPNNHSIISQLENYKSSASSCKRLCDPCTFSEKENEAKYWCRDCGEALCSSCSDDHRKKALRNHKIVAIDEMKEVPVNSDDIDEPCPQHGGKPYEIYCVDHHQMCCVICLATKHRECKIKTIDEMAEEMKNKESIAEFNHILDEIKIKTATYAQAKLQNIETVDRTYKNIKLTATNSVTIAKAKLDHLLDKFNTDLGHIHKSQRQLLIDSKEKIDGFHKTVVNGHRLVHAVSLKGNAKHLFVTTEKVKFQLLNHVQQLKKDLSHDRRVDYSLSLAKIFDDITRTGTAGILELSSTPNHSEIESIFSMVKLTSGEDPFFSADIEKIGVIQIGDIRSKGSDFTGGVFLDNGKIVFADRMKNVLKVYDFGTDIINISNHNLDKPPFDIARTLDGDLLVSFYQSIILEKYRNGTYDRLNNYEVTDRSCRIQIFQNGVMLSSKYNSRVSVLDNHCNVLSVLRRGPKNSYTFLGASRDNDKLFYKDNNSIVCCALDGKELFRYQNQILSGNITGIALDLKENIYVSCCSVGSIYLISADGVKGRVLLSKVNGINEPYAIGFDITGKRFFVTSNGEDITAKIFDLSLKKK